MRDMGDERLHPWLPVLRDGAEGIRVGPARRPVPAADVASVVDAVRRLRERRTSAGTGHDILSGTGHVVDAAPLAQTARRGGDALARAHLTRHAVEPGSGHLVDRRLRDVEVTGPAALADPLREALTAAGCRPSSSSPCLVVSCGAPRASDVHDWTLDGRPHLVVSPRAASIRVGPLVVPGRTPCLHCLDLARRDADPAWPALARQLRARDTPLPDPVLVLAAGALAAGCVTRWLETGQDDICAGFWVVTPDTPVPMWRALLRHPECGCWWPSAPPDSKER